MTEQIIRAQRLGFGTEDKILADEPMKPGAALSTIEHDVPQTEFC